MKKSGLIIGGMLILGLLIAALLFSLRDTTDTKIQETREQPVQEGAEKNHNRWQITRQTSSEITLPHNASTPSTEKDTKEALQTGEEDPHVRLNFLDDLIRLSLKHYHPAHSISNPGTYGVLTLNVKTLNMHYGLSLEGLEYPEEDMNTARQEILSYVLTPHTLGFLFDLYGKECMARADEIAAAALKKYPGTGQKITTRPLSIKQKKEFFTLCSKKMRDIGKIITRMAAIPDFSKKMKTYHSARKELNTAYYTFWGAKESNTDQAHIDTSANEIKKAIIIFDQNKKNLIANIVNAAHPVMTSNTEILYLAEWISRRITNQSTSMETITSLGSELEKLANIFSDHALEIQ